MSWGLRDDCDLELQSSFKAEYAGRKSAKEPPVRICLCNITN